MVGMNVRKEYLPHHTIGSVAEGGDEYKKKSLLRNIDDKLYDIKNTLEGKEYFIQINYCFAYSFVSIPISLCLVIIISLALRKRKVMA